MSEQTESANENKNDSISMKVVAKWIVIIIAILATVYFVIYFGHGNLAQGRLAQFGDFVGGTLNPLLGFVTIGLLIYSIQIQMKELRLTREELKLSRKTMEQQVTQIESQAKTNQLEKIFKVEKSAYIDISNCILISDIQISQIIGLSSAETRGFHLTYHDIFMGTYKGTPLTDSQHLALLEEIQKSHNNESTEAFLNRTSNCLRTYAIAAHDLVNNMNSSYITSYLTHPHGALIGFRTIATVLYGKESNIYKQLDSSYNFLERTIKEFTNPR